MQNNHILIFVAKEKFSQIELDIIKNFLISRKIKFSIISDTANYCMSDKNIRLVPDIKFYNLHTSNFTALIIIGGTGILEYKLNDFLKNIVINFNNNNKIIGAICNAPVLLDNYQILTNKKLNCYPQNKHLLRYNNYSEDNIIINGNIITAKDSSLSLEFIKTIINKIKGNLIWNISSPE